MAFAGSLEAYVGNIPYGASASQLQEYFAGYGIEVAAVELKLKKGSSTRAGFGFVQVPSAEALEKMIGLNGHLFQLRRLQIQKSRRSSNAALSQPQNVETFEGCSITLGVHQPESRRYLERWSTVEDLDVSNVKVTFNFQKEYSHLCFEYQQHEYMLKFSLRDIDAAYTWGRYGVVLRFRCAPLIFRQNVSVGSILSDCRWVRGDVEEGRDWRRTVDLVTFGELLGKYFDYKLNLPTADAVQILTKRLREDVGYDVVSLDSLVSCPLVTQLTEQRAEQLSRDVPFDILFQLECLVSNGQLFKETLTPEFYSILREFPPSRCHRALEHIFMSNGIVEQPVQELRTALSLADNYLLRKPQVQMRDELVMVGRVYFTPLCRYCWGPEVDTANRVLRQYQDIADSFLRVTFTDEHWERMPVGSADRPLTEVLERVRELLDEGFWLGNRHFQFLAMSASQLREHSCWFFAERGGLTASHIRSWMGDFRQIHNVAKYAARMGQCFSSTTTSPLLVLGQHEFKTVDDIKTRDKMYTFSEGAGCISTSVSCLAPNSVSLLDPYP